MQKVCILICESIAVISSTQFCFTCFKDINFMPGDPADHVLPCSRGKDICNILKYPE